ncbi:MAG: pyridoxamine 5'-phosphate oxidase family protein [Acidimicrobiales bacterium]
MQRNPRSRLEVLDYDECTLLLASADIGRLAWVGPAGALLVPVNFEWTGTAIRIRTDPGARVQEIIDHPVAFEIDGLDPRQRIGWSVVVTGPAQLVDEAPGSSRTASLRSWAPGSKSLCVEVVARNISGRRLFAASPQPSPGQEPAEQVEQLTQPTPAGPNPFWRMSAYS